METSLGEKVIEILIKSKTLVLHLVLGDRGSNFKTLVPLDILRDLLNKFYSNDNEKTMLQKLAHLILNYFNWIKP